MRSDYAILIDNREKKPLLFPSYLVTLDPLHPPESRKSRSIHLTPQPATLPCGDYALAGFEHLCIIERKGSLLELCQNLLGPDRTRALASFDRLIASTRHPYVLLEGHPTVLLSRTVTTPGGSLDSGLPVDALLRLLASRPTLNLLWLPADTHAQRRAVGEWCARLLLSHSLAA